jgi:hypothetical protein
MLAQLRYLRVRTIKYDDFFSSSLLTAPSAPPKASTDQCFQYVPHLKNRLFEVPPCFPPSLWVRILTVLPTQQKQEQPECHSAHKEKTLQVGKQLHSSTHHNSEVTEPMVTSRNAVRSLTGNLANRVSRTCKSPQLPIDIVHCCQRHLSRFELDLNTRLRQASLQSTANTQEQDKRCTLSSCLPGIIHGVFVPTTP